MRRDSPAANQLMCLSPGGHLPWCCRTSVCMALATKVKSTCGAGGSMAATEDTRDVQGAQEGWGLPQGAHVRKGSPATPSWFLPGFCSCLSPVCIPPTLSWVGQSESLSPPWTRMDLTSCSSAEATLCAPLGTHATEKPMEGPLHLLTLQHSLHGAHRPPHLTISPITSHLSP